MSNVELVSVRQAAAILGLSDTRVHQLIREGRLIPFARLPAATLLALVDVEALAVERLHHPPRPGRPLTPEAFPPGTIGRPPT